MGRILLGSLFLGGCLFNPLVEVDKQTVDMPRGTSADVTVTIDGTPVDDLDDVIWAVSDPTIVTVTPAPDGRHLRIGGNLEGHTVVHVSSRGQLVHIDANVAPPAIVKMWIEPPTIAVRLGGELQVKAFAVDTLYRLVDLSRDSRWTVRNPGVASLETAGMMLHADALGQTTLHVTNGTSSAVVPVEILK